MKIYNTLTRRKEEFHTVEPGRVKMYVCGPTVYNKAHVGHAMSALVFDVIRRYLMYQGYVVEHVMNYTDVDDKIFLRAKQIRQDPLQLAETYIKAYQDHLLALNILPPVVAPRVSEEMDFIFTIIKGLIERNLAYQVDSEVYFAVENLPAYGKLSGRRLSEMQIEPRSINNHRKRHPMDFILWQAAASGEPAWDSPWGRGRPGWHIECSAMSLHHLGDQIDIHGGGNDLIFPHHENEMAQTEGLTGKIFARYWVHHGMMQFKGERMSKSLGNLVTIEDFLAEYDADVLRLMVLQAGYRNTISFSTDTIQDAVHRMEQLSGAFRPPLPGASGAPDEIVEALEKQVVETREGFIHAMDDDFNTAMGLRCLFDLERKISQAREARATDVEMQDARSVYRELLDVLGLKIGLQPEKDQSVDEWIELMVEIWQELQRNEQWALANQIRDRLLKHGVFIDEDHSVAKWHRGF